MSFDFARFARCSPDKNGFVDFPHSRREFFDFSPFAKYSICDTSSICTESDSICFASSVDICKERRVQEHTDCSSCTIDADASQTTEATEDESVLHHPVLSEREAVLIKVSKRGPFADRKDKNLSRNIALTEVLEWKCKNTCTMDCIKSLKHLDALRESWVNLVLDLRRTTFAYAEQQANIHIEKILKTCLRISRVSLQYVVGGVQVCKEAFYWAHGFSESNFNKVHARVNEEYNASNPVKEEVPIQLRFKQENVVTRTKTAKKWIAQFLLLMRHHPPNADSPKAQISTIAVKTLFQQYTTWADAAREMPIPYDGFRGLFSIVFSTLELVMRNSKQGTAACWICELLKQFLKDTVGHAEASWVRDLGAEHHKFHNSETAFYEDVCFKSKDPGSGIISLNTDGAASDAHSLPKVASSRVAKDIPEWPQKLQGVLVHGKAISLYNLFHCVKSGANMMLTSLLRTFQQLDLKLAGTVYLRVDGGPENWNSTVFAVLDLLFDMYPELQELIISRFGVGHTHGDLDRIFSYINRALQGRGFGGYEHGRNVLTREEFCDIIKAALAANKDTMLLAASVEDLLFTFDFKSFIEPHLYSEFKGHGSSGQIHVFRYRRVANRADPHISYKYWHQSSEWMPADGRSLKILATRPDLRDASKIMVTPYDVGAFTALTAKQSKLLKWLNKRKDVGLASDAQIAQWRAFFMSIPSCATRTFEFVFPGSSGAVSAVAAAPSVGASAVASLPLLRHPPAHLSAPRQQQLQVLQSHLCGEQKGPSVEPIPYPGYSAAERDRLVRQAKGNVGRARGRGRSDARGRGRGPGVNGPLAQLLASVPDTQLDCFYPLEIICERYLYDQRQYEVKWNASVTSKHKKAAFKTKKILSVVTESADSKYALVEWRDTWEMADDFDLAEDHQELVQVWRDYCAENNIKTPVSPPASDDEGGSSEQDEESDKNSASNESGSESEATNSSIRTLCLSRVHDKAAQPTKHRESKAAVKRKSPTSARAAPKPQKKKRQLAST